MKKLMKTKIIYKLTLSFVCSLLILLFVFSVNTKSDDVASADTTSKQIYIGEGSYVDGNKNIGINVYMTVNQTVDTETNTSKPSFTMNYNPYQSGFSYYTIEARLHINGVFNCSRYWMNGDWSNEKNVTISDGSLSGEGFHEISVNINISTGYFPTNRVNKNVYSSVLKDTSAPYMEKYQQSGSGMVYGSLTNNQYINSYIAAYYKDTYLYTKRYHRVDGGEWNSWGGFEGEVGAPIGPFWGSAEQKWETYAVDEVGNESSVLTTYFDNMAPRLTSNKGSVTNTGFTVNMEDGGSDYIDLSQFQFKEPGGTWTPINAWSKTITSSSDEGVYSFQATDRAGNSSTLDVILDKTKPVLTSNIGSGGFTKTLRTVSVSDTNHDKIKYLEPGGTWKETTATSVTMTAINGLWRFQAVDKAGNVSNYFELTFDNINPTISCSVAMNGFTNQLKLVTGSDTNFQKLQYMEPGTSNWQDASGTTYTYTAINGLWQFRATDKAGNISAVYKFTFDNIKPVLSSSIALNTFVNTQSSVSVSDVNHLNFSYKEPGQDWVNIEETTYTGNATNGLWQFKATDKAGNVSNVFQYTFDTIAPLLTIQGRKGEGAFATGNDSDFFNQAYITSSDTNYSTNNQVKFRATIGSGSWQDYLYYLVPVYYDNRKEGLEIVYYTSKQAAADVIIPDLITTIQAKINWKYTDYQSLIAGGTYAYGAGQQDLAVEGADFWLFWSRKVNKTLIYFNYASLTSYISDINNGDVAEYITTETNQILRVEGEYQLTVYDKAGNSTTKTLKIDKTAPTVQCTVPNNGYTRTIRTVFNNDSNPHKIDYKEPGKAWATVEASQMNITAVNGLWEFRVIDRAGNISDIYKFTFDNVKPVLTSSIVLNSFVNTQSKVSVADINLQVFLYKEPGKDWEVVTETYHTGNATNGLWQFKATDNAGNISDVFQYTFDSVSPSVSGVDNNSYYNTNRTITFSDVNFDTAKFARNDNSEGFPTEATTDFTSETLFTLEGKFFIEVIDKAGNKTTRTFCIDKTAPTITGITNNGFYNANKAVSFSDYNFSYAKYSRSDNSAGNPTSSATTFTSGMSFSSEGRYRIEVADKAGNKSILVFCIDKTAPSITGITDGGFYNANKTIVFADDNFNSAKYSRNDNSGVNPTVAGTDFTSETSFTLEGRFFIEVTDRAGNKSTRTFCIDKTKPVLSSSVATGAFVNTVKTVSLSDFNHEKLKYLEPGGTWKEVPSTSVDMIAVNGLWRFQAVDKAGNVSEVFEITFDNIKPVLSSSIALNSFVNTQSKVSATDVNHLNFSYKEPGKDWATITDSFYTAGNTNGLWQFKATDKAGNESDVYKYTFDNIKPVVSCSVTLNGFTNQLKPVTGSDTNFQKLQYMEPSTSSWIDVNDTSYTYTAKNGAWQFRATDKAGNISAIYKFTFDDVSPVVSSSVTLDGYTNQLKPVTGSDTNFQKLQYMEPGTSSWIDVNDTSYTYTAKNGAWQFRATDKAGNISAIYKFTFDNIKPVLSSSIALNAFVNTQSKVSATDVNHLNFSYKEPGKDWATITDSFYTAGNTNGLWQFKATDKAGNVSDVYQYTFDNVLPIIGLRKENNVILVDGGFTNAGVYFEPADINFDKILLYKSISDNWQIIDSTYTVGSYFYDTRETEDISMFKKRDDAIRYIEAKEMQRVVVKSSWNITVAGIIPDEQKDLAIDGMSYYEYTLSSGEIYLFFEIKGLGTFITSKANSYIGSSSHETFFDEGYFKVEAIDKAGNISFKTFTIDTQIPLGAFVELANGAITNRAKVSFRFEKEGVTVKDHVNGAVRDLTAVYESEGKKYRIDITEEGYHNLVLEDKAGNISNYQIYIDRTYVKVSHQDIVLQALEYTNKNTYVIDIVDDVELDEVKINGTVAYKTAEENKKRSFTITVALEQEHVIEVTDRAGNKKTYRVVMDRTKPTIVFSGTLTQEGIKVYSNTTVTALSKDDKAGVLSSSIKNLQTNTVSSLALSQEIIVADGMYKLTVKDKAGNIQEYDFIKYTNNDFGNIEQIRNEYMIVSYYKVTLPAYIFNRPNMPSIAGVYNFKEESAAIEFAREKEFEYRVQRVTESEWLYISASNESVSQKYTNEQELRSIVNMYARNYVSDRIIVKEFSQGLAGTIMNEAEFIVNKASVPEFLSDYSDLEIHTLKHSFVFSQRNTEYGVKGQARLTYLADDFQVKPEKIIEHFALETILESLSRAEHVKQGYYLVEEYDKCKNSFKYLAYIDLEKPTLKTEIVKGNNTREELVISQTYVNENMNVMRYLSFEPLSLLDNIDGDFVVLRIEGRNIEKSFIKGDRLPTLDFNNGYKGKYMITLYDRSYNILKFEIIIAGEVPSWNTTSLAETTEYVRISFIINDSLNAFETINIYKIAGSGAKTKLETDAESVPINAATLYYKFVTGGKYQAEMIDLYGRTTWTRPIFYLKGLPKGILNIQDGALTNRDVVFSFNTKYEAIAYTLSGEERTLTTDYLVAVDDVAKTKTITFIAKEGIDRVPYLIYLYDKVDNNTFVEYTFGIDTVISPISMHTRNTQKEVVKGGSSNEGVVIEYEDSDLVIRYTVNQNVRRYRRGDVLEEDGLYSITVQDIVGNREEFSLYIDTKVRYKVVGEYMTLDDGKLLSNKTVAIEVLEPVSTYRVKDKGLRQDEPFVEDGTYEIYIEDNYGNSVEIVIEIDKTVPEAILIGIEPGMAKTKEKVSVQFEDGAEAFLYKSYNLLKQLENNEAIDAEGVYRVVVQDRAGNKTTLNFEIDRTVEASLSIPNMSITTGKVTISSKEDIQMSVFKNGEAIELATIYEEPGEYKAVVTDGVKNTKEMYFLIIEKGFQVLELPNFKDSRIISVQKDGYVIEHEGTTFLTTGKYELLLATSAQEQYTLSFVIDADVPALDIVTDKKRAVSFTNISKDGLRGVLYKDGSVIDDNFSLSSTVRDPGAYTLVISDGYGNTNTYEFEIKKYLNTAGIVGIAIASAVVLGVLLFAIIAKLRMKAH